MNGRCTAQYRHQEFLKFLRRVDRELPAHMNLTLRSECVSLQRLKAGGKLRQPLRLSWIDTRDCAHPIIYVSGGRFVDWHFSAAG